MSREYTFAAVTERIAAVCGISREEAAKRLQSATGKPTANGDVDLNFAGQEKPDFSKTQPYQRPRHEQPLKL